MTSSSVLASECVAVGIPSEEERLKIDLEFVQNLANARYLNFLAKNKYFDQPEFINYLKYLQYWNEPRYKRLLLFPQCLEFLNAIIHNEHFRKEVNFPQFIAFVHQQQGAIWMLDKEQIKLTEFNEAISLSQDKDPVPNAK